jgi:hypothetical protein
MHLRRPPLRRAPLPERQAAQIVRRNFHNRLPFRYRVTSESSVVWANLDSKIYPFKNNADGNTRQGAYMRERDARAAGSRAAKDKKRS